MTVDHNISSGGYNEMDMLNQSAIPINGTNISVSFGEFLDDAQDVNHSNISYDDMVYPVIKQPMHMVIIYSLAYSLIFLLGLCGNVLVISVVYRNPRMHNVTNYFIVNLAFADMSVCIVCLPITLLSNLYTGWVFGAVMCKVTPFMQGVAVSASVSTLAAISLDRYLAICYTLEFRMTRKTARIAILFIWALAVALMTPWAIFYHHYPAIETPVQTIYVCEQQWPSKAQEKIYFLGAIFIACYSIPLVMIIISYALIARRVWNRDAPGIANTSAAVLKSKIKVLKMLVVVVVLFVTSWLPVYAIQIRLYFGPPLDTTSREFTWLTQIIVPVAQWWGSANSCVNPIIYCLFSKKFRQGFTVIVHCCKGTKGSKSHWMRNSSLMYKSVCDQDGHTMYSHIENRLTDKRIVHKPDISEEQTCF